MRLSIRDTDDREKKIVSFLRQYLKKSRLGRRICEKYDEDEDFIDAIPISFEPLDVSAKTVNGSIILNRKLLEGELRDCLRYVLHEAVHALQQENGDVDSGKDNDYLDDPYEVEAFWYQLEGMEEMYSPEEVQEYLEGLLDHHGLKGKKRKEKAEELTEEEEPEKPADEVDNKDED